MPVLPNYLAVGRGSGCVAPGVMEAFRQYFHEAINVGGTELGFKARWDGFKEKLLSAAWVSAGESEDDHLRQENVDDMSAQLDVRSPLQLLTLLVILLLFFSSFTDI